MSAQVKSKIGIFGGSFDPPHWGHFLTVRVAAEFVGLNKVLVVPVNFHPHKGKKIVASAELRLLMVEAMIKDDRLFEVSKIELDSDQFSYTVDTLEKLTAIYPDTSYELHYIVGLDAFSGIMKWKNPERLFELASFVVLRRVTEEAPSISPEFHGRTIFVDTPQIGLSSSWLRTRIKQKYPIQYAVGKEVADIIRKHNIYR